MKSENNRIEYKRSVTDDLEKEVVAFLNYHEGGLIYIGIDKTGKTIGVPDADQLQLKIKDRLKNNIQPSVMGLFDIVLKEQDGVEIIKIIIASGPEKPYYIRKYGMSEKGCFIRVGSSAEPMPAKMIEKLYSKRTRHSISKIRSGKQRLTFEQLKIYYEAAGMNLNSHFASNLELLTEEDEFNYVAYLLSDANNISIQVAKYDNNTRVKLVEKNEYGYCSLVKAAKQILDKIQLENKTLAEITYFKRKEKKLWAPIALREAIINAFVHNDYTKEVLPKFEIFNDRIEITSAGGIPEDLSKREFFEGYSVPRNKEIMRVFKDLDLVEHLGSGVPRILESYDKDCFDFSDNFLRITFPMELPLNSTLLVQEPVTPYIKTSGFKDGFGTIAERIAASPEKNTAYLRGIYGVITGYLRGIYDIDAAEIKEASGEKALFIIELIAIAPELTRQNMADILGISLSTVEKTIRLLRQQGYIDRKGADKTGQWKILKQH